MSEDIFGVRNGGQWLEPRDAPELPVKHRTAPPRVTGSPGSSVWELRNWKLAGKRWGTEVSAESTTATRGGETEARRKAWAV